MFNFPFLKVHVQVHQHPPYQRRQHGEGPSQLRSPEAYGLLQPGAQLQPVQPQHIRQQQKQLFGEDDQLILPAEPRSKQSGKQQQGLQQVQELRGGEPGAEDQGQHDGVQDDAVESGVHQVPHQPRRKRL